MVFAVIMSEMVFMIVDTEPPWSYIKIIIMSCDIATVVRYGLIESIFIFITFMIWFNF